MFDTLKKKSLKASITVAIFLILIGGVLTYLFARNAMSVFTGYVAFEELEPEEIKNQLVNVQIVENFGCYLEEYEENTSTHTTRTTDYYYIIYTGASDDLETDYKFMSIKVPAKYGKVMDDMTDNTYDGILSSPVSFSGKIMKLDEEETRYFNEFWEEMGFTQDEIDEMTLPYYINAYADKANAASTNGANIAFAGLGLLLIVWGIVLIIRSSTGASLNTLKKSIALGGQTEASAESDFNSAISFTKKDSVKLGRLFLFYDLNSSKPKAIPCSKMVWAYQSTTTHRTNGIKTGTTYALMVFAEGYKNALLVSVPDEQTAQDILQKIKERFPWVMLGYSKELEKMYKKEHEKFLSLLYNTVEHVAVEPGFEGFNDQYNNVQQ